MHIYKLVILAPFFLVNQAPHLVPQTSQEAPHHVIKPKTVSIVKPTPPTAAPAPPAPTPPAPPAPVTFPVAPTGTYANGYLPGQCTAYVASRVKVPDSFGNANNWALAAAADGITVSPIPLAGAIGQTSRGAFGHVVVVLQVEGNQVLIAEQNYDYQGSIRERWTDASEFTYIYI